MGPDKPLYSDFTEEDIQFLTWAMDFIEGGPFSKELEQKRQDIVFKLRIKQLGLEEDIFRTASDPIWWYLHPDISKVSKSRFESGHNSDSVEAAFKEINKIIKEKVKSKTGEELDGASLMTKAFSPKNPIIELADLSTESGKNTQQGFMLIFAGAMTGIRNPSAHENLRITKNMAIHYLFFASLLMCILDENV